MEIVNSDFVSKEEQETLLNWIVSIHHEFRRIDDYRSCLRFENYTQAMPDEVFEIKDRIMDEFGLRQYEDPNRKRYIFANYFTDKAQLHVHRHFPPEGYVDLRCNLMLKLPTSGGMPIVEGRTCVIEERSLWLFNANLDHWTEVVVGGRPRIMLSYAFMVPAEKLPV